MQVKLLPLILSNTVDADNIVVRGADIHVQRLAEGRAMPFWEAITFGETKTTLGSLKLDDVSFAYASSGDFTWQVDSSSAYMTDIGSEASTINFTLRNLHVISVDSLFVITSPIITYASTSGTLEVVHARCQPSLPQREFYLRTNAQQDFLTLGVRYAHFFGLHLDSLLDRQLLADSLHMEAPRFEIANDTVAAVGDTSFKKYPVRLLADAGFGIRVRHASVVDGSILYTERSLETGTLGTVTFDDINGYLQNVTNDSSDIATDSTCEVQLSCSHDGN
jgi:hypothetical protein